MGYFVLIFVFSFLTQTCFSQSKPKANDPEIFIGFYNKKESKKKLKRAFHIKDSCFYKNTDEELAVAFKDSLQSFLITLRFVTPESQVLVDYCTQQEIITDCYDCAIKFMERLLTAKSYKWRKTTDNKYVSTYKVHTQLEVNFNSKESISFILTYMDMPTAEFKAWYNSLVKPDF